MLEWKQALAEHWSSLRFGAFRVESSAREHSVQVEVQLGGLRADFVRLQLYADSLNGEPPFVAEMTRREGAQNATDHRLYAAVVPASRPSWDYTPRVVPAYPGGEVPLEDGHILWFR
jgi:starch phosphorylase